MSTSIEQSLPGLHLHLKLILTTRTPHAHSHNTLGAASATDLQSANILHRKPSRNSIQQQQNVQKTTTVRKFEIANNYNYTDYFSQQLHAHKHTLFTCMLRIIIVTCCSASVLGIVKLGTACTLHGNFCMEFDVYISDLENRKIQ